MAFDRERFGRLYPWTGNHLEVGPGVRLHYLDVGAGEPVVMLHGNPTWSFYYRHLVAHLSPNHRCIVPDHVGMGLSDKPGDDRYEYTLERRVDDLDRLLAHLGLDRDLTVIAHDWGGMIGLAWAARRPGRVKRWILGNTAGFGLPPGKRLPKRIGVVRHLPFFPVPNRGLNLFLKGTLRYCSIRGLSPEVKAAYLAPYDSWAHRIGIQRFVEDIPLAPGDRSFALVDDVRERLPAIVDGPLLLLWGARDFVFDDHFLAEWQRRLPGAEVHRYPDAGHLVFEDAREECARQIDAFLARHPLASRSAAP
jgi:pimeloyl-ACP methyl ester carboxylesterase